MKKILLVAIVVLLFGAGIGCAVDAPATPATSPFATIVYVDQKDAAEAAARTAADTVLVNADTAIKNSVTELNTKVTGSTSGYTKAEVDAKLAERDTKITALETKLNQLSPTTTPTTPAMGTVACSIYNINPAVVNPGGTYQIYIEINNTYDAVKRCNLQGTLMGDTALSNVNATATTFTSGSPYLTGFSTSFVPVNGLNCQMINTVSTQILMPSKTKILIPITFLLAYQTVPGTPPIWTNQWNIINIQ